MYYTEIFWMHFSKRLANLEYLNGFYLPKHVGKHFSHENNRDRIEIVFYILGAQNISRYIKYKKDETTSFTYLLTFT